MGGAAGLRVAGCAVDAQPGARSKWPAWLLLALLSACAASSNRAPVTERLPESGIASGSAEAKEADWRPTTYTVKKGDTLYSIALEHGYDYQELTAWNRLDDPNRILVGQQLRFTPPPEAVVTPPSSPAAAPIETATTTPLQTTPPPVEGKPVAAAVEIKRQPKALKLPYSEAALVQAQAAEGAPDKVAAAAEPAPEPAKAAQAEAKPQPQAPPVTEGEDSIEWGWPASGKVAAKFSDKANLNGVDIAGTLGQPVLASAAGKVVYSGSGIRGYGKLIVIKHSRNYSSVYTHNNEILVKEGQLVAKGQQIAEMGKTDTDQVKLHFEIRRLGRPVDPEKYLPGDTS